MKFEILAQRGKNEELPPVGAVIARRRVIAAMVVGFSIRTFGQREREIHGAEIARGRKVTMMIQRKGENKWAAILTWLLGIREWLNQEKKISPSHDQIRILCGSYIKNYACCFSKTLTITLI
jgi:hypothetical protein